MNRWWLGALHVVGYVFASFVWMAVLAGGAVLVAVLNPELVGPVSIDDLSRPATSELIGIIGLFTIVQLTGMAAIAAVGALFVPTADGSPVGVRRLQQNLAFTRASWAGLALAGLIGVVGGFFPSWVSQIFDRWLPDPMVDELILSALDGSLFARVVMAVAVAVAAPLCEELVFRGYLWSALERYGNSASAFVITSVVFAAYHLDPGQVLGVLPIAFTLGWARWWTGSVWPAIVLHAANNGLALLAASAGPEVAAATVPTWLGLGSLGVTLACCAALTRVGR